MSKYEDLLAFQLRAAGVTGWEQQLRFSPARMWRADFGWRAERLLVEVDGGTWTNGRHTRGKGYEADCEKQDEAVLLGFRCLRFTGAQVSDGYALDCIRRALGRE